jgi:hypothetical protein
MEFRHTLGVLYTQAEEIRNLAEKLQASDGIRTIDLDLLLEKLRNIYDLILDLKESIPATRTGQNSANDEAEPAVLPQIEEYVPSAKDRNPVSNVISVDEKKEIQAGEGKSGVKTAGNESPPPEKRFISDRFKGSKQTLHEEIAGRVKQEDISSQYKAKPIGNIMSAIALNERFELINQLFNGDKESFERTIDVLNMAGSFVDAYNYLQENFNWDMDNEYVQRILELIRRKLIVRRNE